MPTLPVSHVKAHLAEVIDLACETGEAVIITQNGEGTAVLQDLASYEAMRRSLAMMKLAAQGERDLTKGKSIPHAEVLRALRTKTGEAKRAVQRVMGALEIIEGFKSAADYVEILTDLRNELTRQIEAKKTAPGGKPAPSPTTRLSHEPRSRYRRGNAR